MTKSTKRLSEWRRRSALLAAQAVLLAPGEKQDRLLRQAEQLKSASEATPWHSPRDSGLSRLQLLDHLLRLARPGVSPARNRRGPVATASRAKPIGSRAAASWSASSTE